MEGLLNIEDVSKALKISVPNIRLQVYKGILPHVKIGRRVLFRPEDIHELIKRSYRPAQEQNN